MGLVTRTMHRGMRGNFLLRAGSKNTAHEQLFLELAEGKFERPDALGMHLLDLQLVLAALQVDGEPAADDDAQAVGQVGERGAKGDAPIDHRPKRSVLVLKGEIKVAELGRARLDTSPSTQTGV